MTQRRLILITRTVVGQYIVQGAEESTLTFIIACCPSVDQNCLLYFFSFLYLNAVQKFHCYKFFLRQISIIAVE